MLVCYAAEARSDWYVLGFSVSCLAVSAYSYLQGSAPLCVLEAIWSLVAFRRWWKRHRLTIISLRKFTRSAPRKDRHNTE